jgi:hypothetical protein
MTAADTPGTSALFISIINSDPIEGMTVAPPICGDQWINDNTRSWSIVHGGWGNGHARLLRFSRLL